MEPVGNPLSALQELPLPEPVVYLPQTVGWLVVGIVLLLLVLYAVWRIVRYRRANAYRREALTELDRIERSLGHNTGAASLLALPVLLKRTAIAATTRERVAALTGDEWLRFLDRSFRGRAFESGAGRLLPRLAYADAPPSDISREEMRALLDLSRRWIKHHHADV